MNITINAVRFRADQGLESFITEKVNKLETFYAGLLGSEVTLRVDAREKPDNKIAEIRLLIPGYDLYAKKQSATFEEATDVAIEALRRQLKKHKEKQHGR